MSAGLLPPEASLLGAQTVSGTPSRARTAHAAPALSQDAGSRSAVHYDPVGLSGPRPSSHPAGVYHLLHLLRAPPALPLPQEGTHTCWAERGGPPLTPPPGPRPSDQWRMPASPSPRGASSMRTRWVPQGEGHLAGSRSTTAPGAPERGGAFQAKQGRRPCARGLTARGPGHLPGPPPSLPQPPPLLQASRTGSLSDKPSSAPGLWT